MVDMNDCKGGDILVTESGQVLTYVARTCHSRWPHVVRYPDGREGSRTDSGMTFDNDEISSLDIKHIFKKIR